MACRHLWKPYADAKRIWQVCVRCGEERHVTTHARVTLETMAWTFEGMERDGCTCRSGEFCAKHPEGS